MAEIVPSADQPQSLSMAPLGANVLPEQDISSQQSAAPAVDQEKLAGMVAEPAGSYVIRTDEQSEVASLDIDTSHLSLQDPQ